VVAALSAAMRSEVTGAYNVGTGLETDVNHLFDLIAAAAGSSVTANHGPDRPGNQRRSCVAIGKIEAELGWKPQVPLAEGIRLTVDYFRQQD